MTLALKIRYTPGDPEPNPACNTQRVVLAWRKARDEYWEREQIREMNEEKLSRRDPETITEFEQVERDKDARQKRQAAIEAEEAREDQRRAREQQADALKKASRAAELFVLFWESTPDDRGNLMLQYAQTIGVLRTMDCGFQNQRQVDACLSSLKSISNCPPEYRVRYKELRMGLVSEKEKERHKDDAR